MPVWKLILKCRYRLNGKWTYFSLEWETLYCQYFLIFRNFLHQALFYDEYYRTLDCVSSNFDFTAAELDDSEFNEYIKEQLKHLGSDNN